jgi:hypothetical protein
MVGLENKVLSHSRRLDCREVFYARFNNLFPEALREHH